MKDYNTPSPTLDTIHDLLHSSSKALILKTALELDVFTVIHNGNNNLVTISEATQCSERGIHALLNSLCPLGFLTKSGDKYNLTPTSNAFLVRDKSTYYGDSYLDALLTWGWELNSKITESIRTGVGVDKDITRLKAVDLWLSWCEAHSLFWPQIAQEAREMWHRINVNVGANPVRILDMACGHGVWGFALAQDNPNVHVTALDLYSEVIAVATKNATAMGVKEQAT